jgi:glyoxylase-like metal-dependent hydrolase (beta-lactamase superfamily II)
VTGGAASVILAPNPSPLTGNGTNTYLVGDGDELLCIDPGPDNDRHLDAILAAIGAAGGHVVAILVSHSHPDHRPLARRLAARVGAPVRCHEPSRWDDGASPLADGERVPAGGLVLEAVHTPGHAGDHLCFFDADSRVLYSGDHILGGMTSVVAPPDGDMTAYMASLQRVRKLQPRVILPGHGPRVENAGALIDEYIAHRRDREAQVLAAIRARGVQVEAVDLVAEIYAEYPRELWEYAAMSVQAHLDKLAREGVLVREVSMDGAGAVPRYSVAGAAGG